MASSDLQINEGTGPQVATHLVSSKHYPVQKLAHGDADTVTNITPATPLPVADTGAYGVNFRVITPSDTAVLNPVPKALHFNSAGNVALEGADGVPATFAVLAGMTLPVRPTQVLASGTTAGLGIVGIF